MLESTVTGSESNATGSESIVKLEITATERHSKFRLALRSSAVGSGFRPRGLDRFRSFGQKDSSTTERRGQRKQALGRTGDHCREDRRQVPALRSLRSLGYSTAVYRFSGILPFPILSLCSGRFASGDGFRHPAPGARGLQRSESKLCRTGVRPFLRSCHSKPKHKDQT